MLKGVVIDQDLLLFDGVIAVPSSYKLSWGVDIHIGSWFGDLPDAWSNWSAPVSTLQRWCQMPTFQALQPASVQAQLGNCLFLIDGGAGTLKTSHECVQRVAAFLDSGLRVLCDAPTIVGRRTLTWALHKSFGAKVRVVGCSSLSPLEKTLTLESTVGRIINEDLAAMKLLCEDFNQSLSAFSASHVLSRAHASVATSKTSDDDLMSIICDLHDEFIRARENLEALERETRADVVSRTSIVVGTSNTFMKANLRDLHELDLPFGALVTDESSMLETGEEIAKMMNLLQQEIVLPDAKKVFVGDLNQKGPSGSACCNVWASAWFLGYTNFTYNIFEVLFSSLTDMNSGQSTKAVVFVNAIRHSNRVGLFAAKLINALVKEQQPTDPLSEVRQDDEQPPAKARKMTKVQLSLNNNTAYLRPVLKGNPRRFDSAMVFFDPEFYTKYQSLMAKDWSMGSSKYCPVATFISALLTLLCGMTPVCTQDCESTVNTVLSLAAVSKKLNPIYKDPGSGPRPESRTPRGWRAGGVGPSAR